MLVHGEEQNSKCVLNFSTPSLRDLGCHGVNVINNLQTLDKASGS